MIWFMNFIHESGVFGYAIVAVGLFSIAVMIERIRVLFFQYSLKADGFFKKMRSLVVEEKIEEAIILCDRFANKPLAKIFKTILERADRDDEAVYQAQDVALSENVPRLAKRLPYLMMLANVATLLGLLGTIQGLIMAFSAVSQADPANKQVLLAQGISVAMYTTALGLAVAIPTIIVYAFLHAKQCNIAESAVEYSSKLVELLTSRVYHDLKREQVYPDNVVPFERKVDMPPPVSRKAS